MNHGHAVTADAAAASRKRNSARTQILETVSTTTHQGWPTQKHPVVYKLPLAGKQTTISNTPIYTALIHAASRKTHPLSLPRRHLLHRVFLCGTHYIYPSLMYTAAALPARICTARPQSSQHKHCEQQYSRLRTSRQASWLLYTKNHPCSNTKAPCYTPHMGCTLLCPHGLVSARRPTCHHNAESPHATDIPYAPDTPSLQYNTPTQVLTNCRHQQVIIPLQEKPSDSNNTILHPSAFQKAHLMRPLMHPTTRTHTWVMQSAHWQNSTPWTRRSAQQ